MFTVCCVYDSDSKQIFFESSCPKYIHIIYIHCNRVSIMLRLILQSELMLERSAFSLQSISKKKKNK